MDNLEQQREELMKQIEVLNRKLETVETEIRTEQMTRYGKICSHKKVYKYVLEKTVIYTCNNCKNNIEEEYTKDSKIIVRSFI